MTRFELDRRRLLGGIGVTLGGVLAPRAFAAGPAYVELEGHLPSLDFRMEDVETGKTATAADFHGHPVILYFGFTRCPDTCPLTMQNAARLVSLMGAKGQGLRILFVTVDLAYDTPARLKGYMAKFGPPPLFTGLRGTPAELKAAAGRYGVFYKAPNGPDSPDPVSGIGHADATYLFAPSGKAIAILTAMPTSQPKLHEVAALIRKTAGA